jgi:peptide chain release factor 1
VVEIRAGEGGDDSKMFVEELMSVYLLYAAKKGLTAEILSTKDGNVSIQVSGAGVWNAFKNEIGKHQVQRIPPTERNGRRHTSIVAVGVLPLFEFKGKPLNEADIEIHCQRGSGPGGQNRNKVNSCVRMKHLPTGLQVMIDGRDQNQNKNKALEILTSRVNTHFFDIAQAAHSADKKEQMGNSARGDKVRVYDYKRNCAEDVRTGKSTDIKRFLKGNLDLLM